MTMPVLSITNCAWQKVNNNKVYAVLKCADDLGMKIILKIRPAYKLIMECYKNETDSRVFNQLPYFGDNSLEGIYKLALESCPLPDHYSTLEYSSISISEFSILNLNNHEIKPDFFNEPTNLTYINLSHNGLKRLSQEVFANVKKLEILDLSFNKFMELPANLL